MIRQFQSWLAPQFGRFVALKRAGGADYRTQEGLLAGFDRYLAEHAPVSSLPQETLVDFLATLDRLSPRGRDNVVDVVWQALVFARRYDARIDALPPRPPTAPANFRLRPPCIISRKEMCAITAAALRLLPSHTLRPVTYATLYGLLFTTGIRIGEARALDIGDLDFDAGQLSVRHGKFGKNRVLPLRDSTVAALERYVDDPRRPIGRAATAPLFVSQRRRRLSYNIANKTFKTLCATAGIGRPLPRLHDLRHSFVVLTVLRWYQEHRNVDTLLPILSTYLGHVSVENTCIYLHENALLLDEANQRFSHKTARLDAVLS